MKRKIVLVTGSSKGIGRATILEFASKDYDVVINYNHSKEEAFELKTLVESKYNVKALVIQGDMSKEEDVKNVLDTILKEFDHIDVLVNNAAMVADNYLKDKSLEEFNKIITNNINSVFLTCKYFGTYMMEQKYGRIVNISSTNGINTYNPISMDYDASKAAIISLTHNFALEFAPYVNVNSVAPGWTNTESVLEMDPSIIKEEKEKIYLKRFAEASEIAKVVVFLASEEANYINGEIIRVDGGC